MISFQEWLTIREDSGEVSQKVQGNADYCTGPLSCKNIGLRSKYIASMKSDSKKDSRIPDKNNLRK